MCVYLLVFEGDETRGGGGDVASGLRWEEERMHEREDRWESFVFCSFVLNRLSRGGVRERSHGRKWRVVEITANARKFPC